MRKTLAALTIAAVPFGVIAATASPAAAYQCEIAIDDTHSVNCNPCPTTAKVVNGVSNKVLGDDLVYCLH